MELIFTRGYYNGAYIREVKNDVIFAWMKWSEFLSRGFEWMERPWRRGSNGATFAAGVRMERPPRGGFEWCDMHGGGSNGATFVARGSNGSSFAGIKVAKRLVGVFDFKYEGSSAFPFCRGGLARGWDGHGLASVLI